MENQPPVSTQIPASSVKADFSFKKVTIKSDKIILTLSSKGGGTIEKWELNGFKYWDGGLVNLIHNSNENINFSYYTKQNLLVDFSNTGFKPDLNYPDTLVINQQNAEQTVRFSYQIPNSNQILRTSFTFHAQSYSFEYKLTLTGFNEVSLDNQLLIGWNHGISFSEKNHQEDMTYAHAYALMASELEDFSAKVDKPSPFMATGQTHWIGIRTKYFSNFTICQNQEATGVEINPTVETNEIKEKYIYYSYNLKFPLKNQETNKYEFIVYLGPLDYSLLKGYKHNLEKMIMSVGWYERFFRPFSILLLTAFTYIQKLVSNWGLVIIIFSILIKIVLHPLTTKSYRSMKEMQILQPKLTEIREKYKKDSARMNQEIMKVYKEHSVNPFGGCLPTLLQMPLLIGLFIVFKSTIQLRGAKFAWWIQDLSLPDTVFHFPFPIPLYGSSFNILPLIMGITMILQSKTTVQDPTQKFMAYFMPIFFIILFNNLPSGLTLYYTVFNIFTIAQQKWITKAT